MAIYEAKSEVTGSVWSVSCEVGQTLAAGDTVMVIESMKMEIPVIAEEGGTVKQILAEKGTAVSEGQAVALLETP